ncbi:MAG: DUF169 domain-containing protein [Candidatus Methanomethyliaceae archaeon]|nr:DUF169 domain-containing protein [Candidatus Methanomethyliaceae archaeon]
MDMKEVAEKIYKYIKPKSKVVGIRFFKSRTEAEGMLKALRRPRKRLTICQIINTARLYGWTWAVFSEDVDCVLGSSVLGLREVDESFKSGEIFIKLGYVTDRDAAKNFADSVPKMRDRVEGFVVGPLEGLEVQPDLVIIYGNGAQMMRVINGAVYATGERLKFGAIGDIGICGDGIAEAYNTQKPQLVVACYGERRFGHTSDDEIAMVIPFKYLEKFVEGLEKTHNAGIRYPIPIAATIAELDIPEVLRVQPKEKGQP